MIMRSGAGALSGKPISFVWKSSCENFTSVPPFIR